MYYYMNLHVGKHAEEGCLMKAPPQPKQLTRKSKHDLQVRIEMKIDPREREDVYHEDGQLGLQATSEPC
jgi:hypothetical protein